MPANWRRSARFFRRSRPRCNQPISPEPGLPSMGRWPMGGTSATNAKSNSGGKSNPLVERPKIWDKAREIDPTFTCANLFWWYAMYSSADITVTPRPMYPADGRKLPDIWTNPPELRQSLQKELGQFPLFKFWGPLTSIDGHAMDCRRGHSRGSAIQSDAVAGLSAAPGLLPATPRA